jgi:hypothetical protein
MSERKAAPPCVAWRRVEGDGGERRVCEHSVGGDRARVLPLIRTRLVAASLAVPLSRLWADVCGRPPTRQPECAARSLSGSSAHRAALHSSSLSHERTPASTPPPQVALHRRPGRQRGHLLQGGHVRDGCVLWAARRRGTGKNRARRRGGGPCIATTTFSFTHTRALRALSFFSCFPLFFQTRTSSTPVRGGREERREEREREREKGRNGGALLPRSTCSHHSLTLPPRLFHPRPTSTEFTNPKH